MKFVFKLQYKSSFAISVVMSNDGPTRISKTRLFWMSQLNSTFKLLLKGISQTKFQRLLSILKIVLHFKMSGNEELYKAIQAHVHRVSVMALTEDGLSLIIKTASSL